MSETNKSNALLSLIRGAETSKGYDDYSTYATVSPPKQVSQMTIGEVRAWQQKAARAGSKSVAIGGYQMIGKTFKSVVGAMGLSDDTIFDQATQDSMGEHLLVRRGYNKWLSGSLSDEQFGDNLAQEWAGLPRITGPKRGRSHYAGDGLNASSTKVDTVLAALAASRNGTPFEYNPARPSTDPLGNPLSVADSPADKERRLRLSAVNPDENYTGADMAQIGQTPSAVFTSKLDDKQTEAAFEASKPTFWEASKMAAEDEWISSLAAGGLNGKEWVPDRDFQFSEDLWKELTTDIPDEYLGGMEGATSELHARKLAEETRRSLEVDQKLGSLGWGGVGLRLSAAILDPAAIVASAATEGAAAPFIYGAKVGRLGRTLRAGAAAGAVNAGIEGALVSQNPIGQWEDVAFAAAAGFVLGGALGAFKKMPEDDALSQVFTAAMADPTSPLGPRLENNGSMGAARVGQEVQLSPAQLVAQESAASPKSAMGKARIDVVGQLKQSENGITRKLVSLFAEDGVGNADGSVNVRGASENVARESRVRVSRFYNDYNSSFAEWSKDQGIGWYQRGPSTRARFNNEVGMAVRREIDASVNTHVSKVASRVKTEFKDLLEFGKEHNIRGFNDVKDNYNYMARRHRIQALDDMVEEYGSGPVNQLMAKSLIDGNMKWRNRNPSKALGTDSLDYEDALKIGDAYIKSIRARKYGEFNLNRALSGQDMDTLKLMLDDAGMASEDITRIIDSVRHKIDSGENGRISNAKMRLDLDETTSVKAFRKDGTQKDISIEDFLENDVEHIFVNYTRSVLGAGYLEDAFSNFKVKDANGDLPLHAPSYDTVKGYIAAEAGTKNISQSKQMEEFRKLDRLHKNVAALPTEAPHKLKEAQRFLRDYNFIRIGGQLGVAQMSEIGNIIGNGGVRVMMNNIPALRNIYRSAKSKKFSDEFYNEIEAIWGFGTDLTRTSPHVKMDDIHGGTFEGRNFEAGKMQKADFALQQGKKITSITSGMAHVNMALQRFNSRVLVQRFMDNAKGDRVINTKRLRVMGFSDEMIGRVNTQLLSHVDETKGMLGRQVKQINIHKWDDLDAKNAFINGVDRWAKKSIQENDIGNMPDFMSFELGKTVGQFRSFMLAAYTKQLLSGLHHRDWETFSSWATSMFFGGLFYTVQTNVNSFGRGDREEYLEERLSLDNIAKASFQRAGFSSFIPMGVDTMAYVGGVDPVFDFRSSNLGSSILGNPTADLMANAQDAIKGVTAPATNPDYQFSQQDYRAITSTLFMQNAFIVRNVLASFGGSLPRYSQ